MIRNLMLLLAAGSLLAYSCKKNASSDLNTGNWLHVKQTAHRDDHRPIIIVKVVDLNGNIIQQAFVLVTNGTDTFSGNTGIDGIFDADIQKFDEWNVYVTANGYFPQSSSVMTVDSVTNVTDSLIAKG